MTEPIQGSVAAVGGGTPPTTGRKAGDRGRLIILVGLAVVLLVTSVLLYAAFSPTLPCGGDCQPRSIGSALGLGTPIESDNSYPPTDWDNNITVQSAASSLTIDSLSFTVESAGGAKVALPVGSYVEVISPVGTSVATYNLSAAAWSGAPLSTVIVVGDTLSVVWEQKLLSDPMTDDVLVVMGSDGYAGVIDVTLA